MLSVSSTSLARGGSVTVTVTGCGEDFQYAEIRLVSGRGDSRLSTAVASSWPGEPTTLQVPTWMPSGAGQVEASCLEPSFSGASDGADIEVFTYAPVAITVAAYPHREPSDILVPAVARDGVLRISGSDCGGRVLINVARGPWRVASRANFHYGSTLLQAEPDGTWAAEIPLRYSVGEFSHEVAPGTMTAFAVCEGQYYPAVSFEVVGSAPAIDLVGPDPSLLYLSQCPEENQFGVLGVVERENGTQTVVTRTGAGRGYGETFVNVPVPADAVEVTWYAGCHGAYDPSFTYRSASWAA